MKNNKITNNRTLTATFEEQVLKSPNATALVFENKSLTYTELNQQINQLANYLLRKTGGIETPIAVCMERSIEMVVAIYAIIKAGGAYVPLEPTHPINRLEYMINQTGAPIVLTQDQFYTPLTTTSAEVIATDRLEENLRKESTANPDLCIKANRLAYVIFTSGSTGNPKGCMNEHRGIMNRLDWMQTELELTPKDNVLQKTPYTFDVSVWEFFWPLQIGAKLVIAKPNGHMDSSYLIHTINKHEITTLHFVPSMLKLFLQDRSVTYCKSLKTVICSGEALRRDHKKNFYHTLSAKLYNMYGPTEAAVDVTSYYCDPTVHEDTIPIGFPMPQVDILILDEQMNELPAGETGEIYIGGVQVARGYINQPDLTAERFIPDPTKEGAIVYKTGDLGRLNENGTIEYLGRTDFQVKIHGVRVELSEIEAHLNQIDGIKDAVVVVWKDHSNEEHLVAYYCETSGYERDQHELKKLLKTNLPDFMIPQQLMHISEMPLLTSGKIDRKKLPAPTFQRTVQTTYTAPASEAESVITCLWKKTLKLDKVGIDDSFFDIGGNSFLLIRISSELNNLYSKEISLMDLFTYPTIRKLSQHINKNNTLKEPVH